MAPEKTTVHVVAADYGCYEGWQRPIGAFSTEQAALAAVGQAVADGMWCAQVLRVTALVLDAPLISAEPDARG
jgi:hypothetical protein